MSPSMFHHATDGGDGQKGLEDCIAGTVNGLTAILP